jgi:hypothetical protein
MAMMELRMPSGSNDDEHHVGRTLGSTYWMTANQLINERSYIYVQYAQKHTMHSGNR